MLSHGGQDGLPAVVDWLLRAPHVFLLWLELHRKQLPPLAPWMNHSTRLGGAHASSPSSCSISSSFRSLQSSASSPTVPSTTSARALPGPVSASPVLTEKLRADLQFLLPHSTYSSLFFVCCRPYSSVLHSTWLEINWPMNELLLINHILL